MAIENNGRSGLDNAYQATQDYSAYMSQASDMSDLEYYMEHFLDVWNHGDREMTLPSGKTKTLSWKDLADAYQKLDGWANNYEYRSMDNSVGAAMLKNAKDALNGTHMDDQHEHQFVFVHDPKTGEMREATVFDMIQYWDDPSVVFTNPSGQDHFTAQEISTHDIWVNHG